MNLGEPNLTHIETRAVWLTGRARTSPKFPRNGPTLRGKFPMSEDSWGRMLAVLEAMKPGLVTTDEPEENGGDD